MSGRLGGGGGGRERFRRDYGSRMEEKGNSGGRGSNPPSRHLWVGNLSHSIGENDLTDHFMQFGELESVAFQPGRSYAFINFKSDHDAVAAMKTLQGFPVAGNPLRIEFAKADKSSTPSRTEDHLHRDEHRSAVRASPFLQKDSRARHSSPDPLNTEKPKMSDRSSEPSEVLWIGFPALLKVEEGILRKAFSPFGEIDKITVFPGRSYAFVQFRNIMSACRAKETLQGKLFGNPRVHICFAKSEAGSSSSGRGSTSAPLSPHFRLNGRLGSSDNFHQDRNYGSMIGDPSTRPPHFVANVDSGDPDVYNFNRKGTLWSGDDNWRLGEVGSEPGLPQDMYELHSSPRERSSLFHDFPQKFPQKSPFYEEPWDLPEDAYYYRGAKKLKTGSFPPEKELPEYPFSDPEQEKHLFPRVFSDFPQPEAFDKNFEAGPFGYKQTPDRQVGLPPPHGERSEHWRASYDNFQVGSGYLPSSAVERKRFTPESDQPSLNDWKWEGTIAKGGTPVCRARCFPVGKVMDIMLPEFLDCTARTGLDMLAKHYYQASSAWVVFFVPESDADMGFYNEFMHYLEEKQRAAVAKLDDNTTLFLVPPSEFSEKVLKVPGKLSISGVVLRLEHPGSGFGPIHHPNETKDANLLTFHGDPLYPKPSGPFPSMAYVPDLGKSGVPDLSFAGNVAMSAPSAPFSGSAHAIGNVPDSYVENRHERPPSQRLGPNWSDHDLQNSVSDTRNIPSQVSNSAGDPTVQGHHSVMPRPVQETSSSHYASGISGIPLSGSNESSLQETKPSGSLSMPIGLQPEQLAQLASSFLGQQRQAGSTPNISMGENVKRMNIMNQFDNPFKPPERYGLQSNQVTPEFSASQFGQVQRLQQQQPQQQQMTSNVPVTRPPEDHPEFQSVAPGNQQLQSSGTQEETDADPQKRLQATLQLAAALLQQIQQGKGT